jgi:hypothetical protein
MRSWCWSSDNARRRWPALARPVTHGRAPSQALRTFGAHLPTCKGLAMRMRVQRRNHDGLLEHLMEPVAREARHRAAEMIRDTASRP